MPKPVEGIPGLSDYSDDGAAVPATTPIAAPAPQASPSVANEVPGIPGLTDYTAGQTAAAPPKAPSTWGQAASKWSNWLIGGDQGPVELQPRSLGQAGTDAYNFARVAGNRAGVPGALDFISDAWNGTDLPTEQAKTAEARKELGPVAAGIADFMGQRASVLRATPWADNPLAQGLVTGGGGTLMSGGDWKDALLNAAANTGLGYAGQAIGTGASSLARKITDKSEQAVSNAASGALEHLHDLQDTGGDIASAAEQYAGAASGAAKDAYRKIATAANQSIDANFPQRLTAGALGSYLPGVGPIASAYIADPAIKAYNQFSRGQNIRSAIDQAYPAVANVVKTAVDPNAWRSAVQSLALSQGPTGSGTLKNGLNYRPEWAKVLWRGLQ